MVQSLQIENADVRSDSREGRQLKSGSGFLTAPDTVQSCDALSCRPKRRRLSERLVKDRNFPWRKNLDARGTPG